MRQLTRSILLTAAVSVLATLACAPLAAAETETGAPWWGLTTGARPTNLGGSSGKDEIQQLRIKATKGDYLLVTVVAGEPQFALLPFNTSATVIREHLEAARPLADAPPTVTEESSGEEHTRLFEIAYPSQAVEPPTVTAEKELVKFFFPEAEPLEDEGKEGEAEATELQKGVASENQIVVYAQNLGNAPTSGKVTISDQLPPGLTATSVSGHAGSNSDHEAGPLVCETKNLTCTFEKNNQGTPGLIPPFEMIEMRIDVQVGPGATNGELNLATVSGGGVSGVTSAHHPISVGAPQRFGIENYSLIPEKAGGLIDTQAGSHPFQLTSIVTLSSQTSDRGGDARTVALPKDLSGELPPGLVGNPTPFAQCTDAQFAQQVDIGNDTINECPAASAVGVSTVTINSDVTHLESTPVPIFNMVPRPGEPARFGFKVKGIVPIFLDTSVRTGGDYGVTVSSTNIIQVDWLLAARLTFWGVPGDPAHDGQRGWQCLLRVEGSAGCPAAHATSPPPLLSMPTSCGTPFQSAIHGDSWAAADKPSEPAEQTYELPEAIDGCNHLPFSPEIRVIPDGNAASTPTGLNVDVHVPQDAALNAESLAESAIKDISVALPEGVAINPAGGDGLQACTEDQIGYESPPVSEPPARLRFTPTLSKSFCPDASKIGTVEIASPLLPPGQHLQGSVYLANQNENPFGSLVAMYIVAEDPISGVLVKLPGEAHLTSTGQIVGTFKNNPQLAFEDAELHFFGGERAPLSTPAHCGAYTTNATFTPWSGNEAVNSTSTFDITSGPNGTPCPGANLPFSPALTGGTTNINAGAFSPLTTTIGREDGQQDMQSVQLQMPLGLSGLLSGVKLCPEAQANEGTCGPDSQIGETTVSAGVGNDPVSVTGGKVYITEKYAGAPFGLSIVNPVKAGPFDLERDTSKPNQNPACDCVVVRAKIDVDPHTAQLTITTDQAGPHSIPHLIDGIPVQIKKVNVLINRPGFTFNPTHCSPMSITGSIASDEGASSPVSVPFQAANCAVLAFAPKFAVTTSAKTSKANGASLGVKLTYPQAPFGTQANIRQVKVELPKALPSRLTTLQKACTAAQFNADPAGCPAASIIGHARAITPLLPVPLEGPAYFVSNGGEAFPNLIMVLQGYGVRLDLVGDTFISKTGITSSTFKTVPDAPVGSFELNLPQGPHSALTANGNLCASKLVMPTEILAQNGAVTHKNTTIAVTGCPKKKTLARAQKLAIALKTCHKRHNHAKRTACERSARKQYGPLKKNRKK